MTTATAALDVLCVGETLVDFLPEAGRGQRVRDVEKWVRCTGGSPANVAVGVSRLGGRSGMLGVVGEDEFGSFLKESLSRDGVDTGHLRQTDEGKTGLVFISLDDRGDRSFAFHRTRAAEFFLSERDFDERYLLSARALHFGSNSLLFRDAQRTALRMAQLGADNGRIVSCDPNLRLHVWSDPNELRGLLQQLLPVCSVVKLAEEETLFVTGKKNPDEALDVLSKMKVLLPIVTLGEQGASFLWHGRRVDVQAPVTAVVDTTGAGDGFMAAMLFGLSRVYGSPDALRGAHVGELRQIASFACHVASRVCERLGAVDGLPTMDVVREVAPKTLLLK